MIKKTKAVVFDLDGVVRIGDKPVSGINDAFQYLIDQSIPFMIATNECRFAPGDIRQMLLKMGVNIPSSCFIYTAGMAMRDYLRTKPNDKGVKHIGVIGEQGLKDILSQEHQIVIHPDGDNHIDYLIVGTLNGVDTNPHRNNWIKSCKKIITTCKDNTDPSSFLMAVPNYTLSSANIDLTNVYSIGKPHCIFAKAIMNEFRSKIPDIAANEILFIGDTLYTDIELAENAGFTSILMLTGNSSYNSLRSIVTTPTYIIENIAGLMTFFESHIGFF